VVDGVVYAASDRGVLFAIAGESDAS
jgi:hypothetical protein